MLPAKSPILVVSLSARVHDILKKGYRPTFLSILCIHVNSQLITSQAVQWRAFGRPEANAVPHSPYPLLQRRSRPIEKSKVWYL